MSNARPKSRRWIEAAAEDLNFDYFADTTGLAGGLPVGDLGGGTLDVTDQFTEFAEIDQELELIEAELLEHEVLEAAGNPVEVTALIKLRVGEIYAVRGWAA